MKIYAHPHGIYCTSRQRAEYGNHVERRRTAAHRRLLKDRVVRMRMEAAPLTDSRTECACAPTRFTCAHAAKMPHWRMPGSTSTEAMRSNIALDTEHMHPMNAYERQSLDLGIVQWPRRASGDVRTSDAHGGWSPAEVGVTSRALEHALDIRQGFSAHQETGSFPTHFGHRPSFRHTPAPSSCRNQS